jgi:hypothetical protein
MANITNVLTYHVLATSAILVFVVGIWSGFLLGRHWERDAWKSCIKIYTNDVRWSDGPLPMTYHECAHSILLYIYGVKELNRDVVIYSSPDKEV